MRRVLKGVDVREGIFAHDVVLARPVGGGGYCGSEIVTALEGMEVADYSFATTSRHALNMLMALRNTNIVKLRVVVPGTYSNEALG
jgi:hypothetical protein